MYVHELYILDTGKHVTILLVDKTSIAIIYKGSYKIPKMEWVILFVILISHRAAYHIEITKGKGSECFTASKTPVGHVMTQFRFVCNITPRLKALAGMSESRWVIVSLTISLWADHFMLCVMNDPKPSHHMTNRGFTGREVFWAFPLSNLYVISGPVTHKYYKQYDSFRLRNPIGTLIYYRYCSLIYQ